MKRPTTRTSGTCVVVLILSMASCAESTEDEQVLTPPEVAGHYNLTGQIVDNGCNALNDWDLWGEVLVWADQTPSGLATFTLDIEQADTVLSAVLLPGLGDGCVLDGSIGAGGAFDLSGSCDDTITRAMSVIGTIDAYGDGWEMSSILSMELDREGDGTFDCEVSHIEISGTGFVPTR